ncbi:MAG TPA: acyltransferase [Chitinophagaceae bacterium]|nr:acyltransferase [Chitinophagaceae bacterium]
MGLLNNNIFGNSLYRLVPLLQFFSSRLKTQLWYKRFLKECGDKNVIIKPMLITPEFISLKNNVLIWYNARIQGVPNYGANQYHPNIILNNRVSIQQNVHITCANRVEIGEDTAIAANVTITDISHPYADIAIAPEYQLLEIGRVYIGPRCKIYNNVVILPDAILGRHCVVGANAVVRGGNYPDFSVIAGNPARIIRRYNIDTRQWQNTEPDGTFKKEK